MFLADLLPNSSSPAFSPIVLGVIGLETILLLLMWRKLATISEKWKYLLKSPSGMNLEELLNDQLRSRLILESKLEKLEQETTILREKVSTSKRHLGLVRYDAFEDVGGAQSFALAVFDDRGDGAILNSVLGRTDCRVYCKPLINGGSERHLSQEEQRAIAAAKDSGPKSIVS